MSLVVIYVIGTTLGFVNGVTRASLPPGLVKSPADITMDSAKLTRLTGIPMKGLEEAVEMVTF